VHLHPRHRPVRHAPVIEADPTAEAASLRALIEQLNGTVESLWWDMRWACTQLALSRGDAHTHCADEQPPAPHVPGPDADTALLRRVLDDLNSTAEAMWWEIQWARAELAAAPPGPGLGRATRFG
jgi:hypothetical protein